MTRRTLPVVLVFLAGCLCTHHVEQTCSVTTGVGVDGQVSCCQEATQEERHWWGPWFVQPDRARP